jgi:predicted TIM-barrel fold metal-dependent hydrolase
VTFPTSGGAIDCHAHVAPAEWVERLGARAKDEEALLASAQWYAAGFAEKLPAPCTRYFFGSPRDRIDAMNQAGVSVQVLSPGSMLAFPGEVAARADLVAAWNDAVHGEIEPLGGRFVQFAGLPLPEVQASLDEIDRVRQRPWHVGFAISSHIGRRDLGDDAWSPVFRRLDELASVVFVHPTQFRAPGVFERTLDVDMGTQFEDALTSVAVYSRLAARYPRIRWLICHLGGALPFLLERLDEHWERDRPHRSLTKAPSESLGSMHFDTAGHGPRAIAFAAEALGVDRLVFGTDFPMVSADDYPGLVERTAGAIHDDGERRRVIHDNPSRLLGLEQPIDRAGPSPAVTIPGRN